MSWDQDYDVPSLQDLLEELTGIPAMQLMVDHLEAKGLKITNVEEVVLDDGFFQTVKGTKVTLSDGRVYIPKLVERFNENGNHGIDFYRYKLIGDEPEVMNVGLDSSDPDVDSYTVPENYGQDNEGC